MWNGSISVGTYEYITVRSVCFKLLALVLMFASVRQRGDYAIYGLIVVVSGYGSNVLNLLRLRSSWTSAIVDISIFPAISNRCYGSPSHPFHPACIFK